MAEEECGESSVVAMSSSLNWWENMHGGGPSWAWQKHGNNPCLDSPTCEDDVSISNSYNTNTSIHSGLTVESSHRLLDPAGTELMLGEHMSDNQLWSHMLLGMGNNGENYVDSSSSSKSMSSYFIGSGGDRHHHNDRLIMPPLRSNLVNDWSIAPPISEVNYLSLDSSSGLFPSETYHKQYGDIKAECELGYGGFQDNSRYCYGRSEDDLVFVGGSVCHKGILGQHHRVVNKPDWKSPALSNHGCKKQGAVPPLPASSSSSVRTNSVKGQASTNGESKKKKTLEDDPESTGVAKKHKHDSSTTSATRMQVTKAKIGDRITTLQQIVSPFGKTDTASVLTETVGCIKFLQEQVRLLVSNPYMKANPHKDLWGGIERKERVDTRVVELRSKGLCLVPVSCTPQVYRDNTGSDYWTPPYRSLLYR